MARTLDEASIINPNILTDTFGTTLFNITPADIPEAKQPEAKQPEAKEMEVKEKPKPKPAGQTMEDLMSSFPKMTDKEREEAKQKVKETKLRAMKKGRERAQEKNVRQIPHHPLLLHLACGVSFTSVFVCCSSFILCCGSLFLFFLSLMFLDAHLLQNGNVS